MSTKKSNEEKSQEVGSVINKSKSNSSSRERASQAARSSAVRAQVAATTVETAVKSVTDLGLKVQKSLSAVSEELQNKIAELAQVDEAILAAKKELEEQHDKDIVASSIEDLIAKYEAKKVELEKAISTAKQEWLEEQDDHQKAVTKAAADREQLWHQEVAEHEYKLRTERQAQTDEWNAQVKAKKLAEEDRVREFNLNIELRTKAMKTVEDDYAQAKQKVAEFPALLAAEVKREAAIAANAVKREYEHKEALAEKDFQAKQSLLTAQVANEIAKNAGYEKTISKLEDDLAKAREQLATLGGKALDAASGANALAVLQQNRAQGNDTNGAGGRKS